jgi:hypothetical protein
MDADAAEAPEATEAEAAEAPDETEADAANPALLAAPEAALYAVWADLLACAAGSP